MKLLLAAGAAFTLALAAAGCSGGEGVSEELNEPSVVSSSSAVTTPAAWPLKTSPNGRYLIDQAGQPVLLQGDTPWELIPALSQADVVTYLNDRAARNVRALIVELVVSPAFRPTNAAGHRAFSGNLGSGHVDLATPNEAYFAHADFVLQQALDRNIAVLLYPLYLGWQGGNEGFYADMVANGATKVRNYGSWVGTRYGRFPNVIWVLGGDYLPPQSGLTLLNELASGIKSTSQHAHPFTAHWGPDQASIESSQSWINLNFAYSYEPNDPYEEVAAGYAASGPVPVFMGESRYERHATNPSRSQIRRQAYSAMLAGACGQFLGNEILWRFATNWQAELNSPGSQDMQRLFALFSTRRWHELVPDTGNTLLTGGRGSFGSTSYVTAAKTPDGRLALAYLPSGGTITVAMSQLSGSEVQARWFDPSNGTLANIGTFPASGSRSFTPPGATADGASDWVLLFESGSCVGCAVCGNGSVESGEACDDGNAVNDDACTNACARATCADGARNQGETGVDCGGPCTACATGGCASDPLPRSAASSSSIWSNDYPASAAIDGSTSTRWSSAVGDPEWIWVDLGASRRIRRVVLSWQNSASSNYDIQVATSSSGPWTTVYTDANGNGGTDDIGNLNATGRYVRMYSRSRTTQWGNSLWEFQVYGDLSPSCSGGSNPVCGNGVSETGEGCDDGNTVNDDFCSNACVAATCSDGARNQLETGIDCGGPCPACVVCGNGVRQGSEQCDDGNGVDNDACSNSCISATCTDGRQNQGEAGIDCGGPCSACSTSCRSDALPRSSATASSTYLTYSPSLVIDGSATTRWSSAMGIDPQWISVDLGAARRIKRVVMRWEDAASRDYDVQVASSSSGPWTTVFTDSRGNGGVDDVAGLNANARYVRIYSRARTTQWGVSLWELEVYGDLTTTCQ